jgi:hypothetical protein
VITAAALVQNHQRFVTGTFSCTSFASRFTSSPALTVTWAS